MQEYRGFTQRHVQFCFTSQLPRPSSAYFLILSCLIQPSLCSLSFPFLCSIILMHITSLGLRKNKILAAFVSQITSFFFHFPFFSVAPHHLYLSLLTTPIVWNGTVLVSLKMDMSTTVSSSVSTPAMTVHFFSVAFSVEFDHFYVDTLNAIMGFRILAT